MTMIYDANKTVWQIGDHVIHDYDRKEARMLMVVLGYTDDGLVKSCYVDKSISKYVYENELKFLHDPARFNIPVPAKV